jgi:hypothetical protein
MTAKETNFPHADMDLKISSMTVRFSCNNHLVCNMLFYFHLICNKLIIKCIQEEEVHVSITVDPSAKM